MYDSNDPYRYGAPTPAPYGMQQPTLYGAMGTRATGKQILSASWGMLRADRQLLVLPVLSSVSALIAGALIFAPGWAIGLAVGGDSRSGGAFGAALSAYAMSIVAIYFQAALVIGANERAEGRVPTLGGVLTLAWRIKGKIIGWAVLTTTVGLVLRAMEERLGVLGKIFGFFAGLGWAVASFFAVPVVVVEGLGPIDAVKRSGALIRQTWGTSLRTTLRWGLVQFLLTIPCVVAIVGGVVLIASGASSSTTAVIIAGALLLLLGIVGVLALAVFASATTVYARALIFRYATGRPVPGVPAEVFAGAFMAKR